MNGFETLYGRDDYENNYSEGETHSRPLHEKLGYRCIADMLAAQKAYAIRRNGDPTDDFEVIE